MLNKRKKQSINIKKIKDFIENKTKEVTNKYIQDIANVDADISRYLNFLIHNNEDFTNKWFDMEIDTFSIILSIMQRDEIESDFRKLVEMRNYAKVDDFGIDFEEMLLKNNINLKNLGKELKKDLVDDGLIEEINTRIRRKNVIVDAWLGSIKVANSFFHPTFWDQMTDMYHLPWPLLTDSYNRDFELFFKLIIRPILYDDKNPRNFNSYSDDLKNFFNSQPGFHDEICRIVIPKFRSKFTHFEYYFNILENNKLIFFHHRDDELNLSEQYELSVFAKLTEKMNLLLWTVIAVIYKKLNKSFKDLKILNLDDSKLDKLLSNKELVNNIEKNDFVKNQFEKTKLTISELDDLFFTDNESQCPQPLVESSQILNTFLTKNIIDDQTIFWMIDKALYLLTHEVVFERFLKPFCLSMNNKLNYYSKNIELLDEFNKYKDGKYRELFSIFDIDMRNALAHMKYYSKNNLMYFTNQQNQEQEIKINYFTKLIMLLDDLEIIFNPDFILNQIKIGITKIILLLFIRTNNLKSINFYLNAYKVLFEEGLYPEIQVICLIISSFFYLKCKNMSKSVNALDIAKEILSNQTDECKINVWAWIAKRSLFFCKDIWEEAFELLFEKLSIIPQNKEARKWIFGYKGIIYANFESKDCNKKANKLLQLYQKI